MNRGAGEAELRASAQASLNSQPAPGPANLTIPRLPLSMPKSHPGEEENLPFKIKWEFALSLK